MRKRWKSDFLFMALALLLLSCHAPQGDASSALISDSDQTSLASTVSYETDPEGFYVLNKDCFAYQENPLDLGQRNKIAFAEAPEGADLYSQARLYVGGKAIPIYSVKVNLNHLWNPTAPGRVEAGVASLEMKGQAKFALQTNFPLNSTCLIRPLAAKIEPTFDDRRRVITFVIDSPGQYTVELSAKRTIHLFVDEINANKDAKDKATMVFAPGIHSQANDSRIGSDGLCVLSSGTSVYLAPGCIFQGGFTANYASNIAIGGPGMIDGSTFERNATTGARLIPLEFDYCSALSFSGFAMLDPAGWCFSLYFGNGIAIDNVKIISSRSNGDGISVQSCQNVEVTNSFVRSWDDSLVVKNYPRWSDPSIEGTTEHVHFSSCRLWTDLAQSMEIGYETVGEVMDDITFSDITVFHAYHLAPLSIHNANNADLTNVKYTNITIEDADLDSSSNRLIDFSAAYSAIWSTSHKTTSVGEVAGVNVTNVLVIAGNDNLLISVKGSVDSRQGYGNREHDVSDVALTDLSITGRTLVSGDRNIETEYAPDFSVASTGKAISGAAFSKTPADGYGWNLDFVPAI